MVQRKKRAAARKQRTEKRGKVSKQAKSAKKKPAKRLAGKTIVKKRVTKAKPRRAGVKKAASRKAGPPKQTSKIPIESLIVDIIEEPIPGVVVVTEFEAMRTRSPGTIAEQIEGDQKPNLPRREQE